MKARYQNPSIGRFVSIDPESRDNPMKFIHDPQQLNSYGYVSNNPLAFIDPFGLEKWYVVSKPILRIFNHSFFVYDPENEDGTGITTYGAYNVNKWNPFKNTLEPDIGSSENETTDYNYITNDEGRIELPEESNRWNELDIDDSDTFKSGLEDSVSSFPATEYNVFGDVCNTWTKQASENTNTNEQVTSFFNQVPGFMTGDGEISREKKENE